MEGRPTYLEINLGALKKNLEKIRSIAKYAQVIAIVKANAYGLGAVPIAKVLEASCVDAFGVACASEGLQLREAGIKKPILILGGIYRGEIKDSLANDLTPVVGGFDQLKQLVIELKRLGRSANVHIKVDTGMGRLGFQINELVKLFDELEKSRGYIKVRGLMSHLACADQPENPYTEYQTKKFREVISLFEKAGYKKVIKHLANSAGIMFWQQTIFDAVRPGIFLYGARPDPYIKTGPKPLPVARFYTKIALIKTVPVGTAVSYGSTFVTKRKTRLGVCPVGYADGYLRGLSNRAEVLVNGKRTHVIGNICMDMTMVDLTDITDAKVGDEVILCGKQGNEEISVEELAKWLGTIPYEILCHIGARVPRIYVD